MKYPDEELILHQRLILFMYKACIVFMLSHFFIGFLVARDPTIPTIVPATAVSIAHAPTGDEYGGCLYRHVCQAVLYCIVGLLVEDLQHASLRVREY